VKLSNSEAVTKRSRLNGSEFADKFFGVDGVSVGSDVAVGKGVEVAVGSGGSVGTSVNVFVGSGISVGRISVAVGGSGVSVNVSSTDSVGDFSNVDNTSGSDWEHPETRRPKIVITKKVI
jgi:hypothetical protein